MGACASMPKEMRGEARAAPPPEPAKEESVQADHQHPTEEVIKVEEAENKANEVDESKQQSLSSLLDEPEKTEGKNEAQKAQVEVQEEPMKEESKQEEAEKGEQKEEAKDELPKVQLKKEEPKTEAEAVQKVNEEDKEKKT